MDQSAKRKASDPAESGNTDKRVKTKKLWRVPRKNDHGTIQATAIQPGDSGIWVTCVKGKEGKCVGEVRDLFAEYATLLYGDSLPAESSMMKGETAEHDIENEIQAEIADIRTPSSVQLFTPVRLDVQCVVFFRTIAPVEPVSFVRRICEDARQKKQRLHTKFAQRLSPMSLLGRASADGLEKVAKEVLAPHFHGEPVQPRKYAIRTNIRNHTKLTRDSVIRQVASMVGVGRGHSVDLKHYDLLILVEIYQNICGVSVVDGAFESLRRYNIAELAQIDQDPSPSDGRSQPTGPAAGSSSHVTAAPDDTDVDIDVDMASSV